MNTKIPHLLFIILTVAAVLTGCNLPFGARPAEPALPPTQELNLLATLTQQAVEHSAQLTQTAPTATLSPTPTLTPLPPQTTSPTAQPQPVDPSEIKFQPGGTIAYLKGKIKAGQQISFTLGAGQGQTLIAVVSSEANQVYFEIKDLDGEQVLVPFSDGASSVQIKLPRAGEYQVTLASPVDLDYFLSVEIPANLVVSPSLGAAVIDGYIDVLDAFHPDVPTRVRYLVGLQSGSTLDVKLSSPGIKGLSLALIGAEDGQPYLRYEVQSASISGLIVPESQGYYLDVYSVSGDAAAFSLTINVK
jgi:hypothetical protein